MGISELFTYENEYLNKINPSLEKFSISHIYHYTSPEGLKGIIKKSNLCLWFSRADCLNDKTEGQEVIRLYKEVCEELLCEKKIDNLFFDRIIEINLFNQRLFKSDSDRDKGSVWRLQEFDAYICCFTKQKDSLPMWNYYAKNDKYEGYNLGFQFDFNNLSSQLSYDNEHLIHIDFFSVIYDENIMKKTLSDFILKVYEYSKRELCEDRCIYSVESAIRKTLNFSRYALKHQSFSHEDEIRLVVFIPKEAKGYPIKFRTKKGLLIPYIEMNVDVKRLKDITIAPLVEQETAQNTLEFFLKQNGYKVRYDDTTDDGVLIKSSEVPIRY